MVFEIAIQTNGMQTIEFKNYDEIYNEAVRLADKMKTVEVTEDNRSENKALLAELRKRIKVLDSETVAVKNKVLEPYQVINQQRNELKEVLNNAIDSINNQLKTFTEKEQEERTLQIKKLFDKYQVSYNAPRWLSFDEFIAKNRSLVTNKATSQKTITQAVVMYFEVFKQDYEDLKEKVAIKDDRSAILMSYSRNGFNMEQAITEYAEMISERERLEAEQQRVRETKVPDIIILTGNENKVVDKPIEVSYTNIKVKTSDLDKLQKLGIEWGEI